MTLPAGARAAGGPGLGALAARRSAIAGRWLALTLESYPAPTARLLARESDPFRNPVGHTLRQALSGLAEELIGTMDPGRVTALLDSVVRVRAVQAMSAGEAVGFVFLARQALREELGSGGGLPAADGLGVLEARVDEMALSAFDLFMRCREQIHAIRAGEARGRTALLDRIREREGRSGGGPAGMDRGASP
ncbi:MAG: RsbRD N-terminal domain-containing protein [Candidatus Rokubacteria bacterium]|nr:RsbRD N-terminal domain-containing protein [Candidatus Rokubacteria bacterium]